MTEADFLADQALPFCAGCGHHLISRNTARALARLGWKPLDVVLVTDIGCHGIVDRYFLTHTVHGLHGRAVALGSAIAAGRRSGKTVVFLGDGGASIGLQHLVESANRNFPVSVVVHNNLLYGMTGGQPSALTPCGFRTPVMPAGKPYAGYDLCRIMIAAGAAYVSRINGAGDFSAALAEAFSVPGFSLVEVIETCPSYGLKHNPGRKPADLCREAGLEFGVWRGADRPVALLEPGTGSSSLLETTEPSQPSSVSPAATPSPHLAEPYTILIAGSAGSGIQHSAEILARAAIASGLHVTKKSSYPVTVGTGFSAAELILSPDPILYTGADRPDAVVVTSADGLEYSRKRIEHLTGGTVILDASLDPPATGATILREPFGAVAGRRNAPLLALLYLVTRTRILPPEQFCAALRSTGDDIEIKALLEKLQHPKGKD
jgi:pyruvate/2-oxoacid:ferredoxin oxidoreductase beta subunit